MRTYVGTVGGKGDLIVSAEILKSIGVKPGESVKITVNGSKSVTINHSETTGEDEHPFSFADTDEDD